MKLLGRGMDYLRLPDGTILASVSGGGEILDFGIRRRQTFYPIPADVHQATLIISCVLESGKEWEIHLSFLQSQVETTILDFN